jgi:hypothetical protein
MLINSLYYKPIKMMINIQNLIRVVSTTTLIQTSLQDFQINKKSRKKKKSNSIKIWKKRELTSEKTSVASIILHKMKFKQQFKKLRINLKENYKSGMGRSHQIDVSA